jgi:glycosyltransferase involved in cell wall biosynthesis
MTKLSCFRAGEVIAVSKATKKDLVKFYDVSEEKIRVVYHGVDAPMNTPAPRGVQGSADERTEKIQPSPIGADEQASLSRPSPINTDEEELTQNKYILYLGRVETKKNILNMIEAFETLKSAEERKETQNIVEQGRGTPNQSKYGTGQSSRNDSAKFSDLKFVLAGGEGYGYRRIQKTIDNSPLTEDIIETGYVSEEEKWRLLNSATVFCFATLYEGFGMPILEAQSVGTSVIVGDKGAGPEVGGGAVLKVAPEEPKEIARAMSRLLEDEDLREELVEKGYKNVESFSWEKCAKKTLEAVTNVSS